MAVSITSAADEVNLALIRIGYKKTIGNLYDGSEAAQAAITIYGQTRDELLRQFDWGFAKGDAVLELLKQAPDFGYIPPTVWSTAYPPQPYRFEYAYPADCLKVRIIKPQAIFTFNADPSYDPYEIANDAVLARKVILCDVVDALCTYTRRVTNPALWETDFCEALAAALGQRLAPALTGLDQAKMGAQDAVVTKVTATQIQG